jgi:hypothetical protein
MPSPWPTDCSTPRESPPGRADAVRAELAVAIVRAANPIAILRILSNPAFQNQTRLFLTWCSRAAQSRGVSQGANVPAFFADWQLSPSPNTRPDGFATADGAIRAASAQGARHGGRFDRGRYRPATPPAGPRRGARREIDQACASLLDELCSGALLAPALSSLPLTIGRSLYLNPLEIPAPAAGR